MTEQARISYSRTQKKAATVDCLFFLPADLARVNQLPLVSPEALSPPFFLDFFFFLSSVVAEALPDLLQHPAEDDLLQEAPLASVEAEAPFEQHPADLDFFFFLSSVVAEALPDLLQHPAEDDLLQEAPLASVEAEAPFEQHPADLDLSQVAFSPLAQDVFWASLEQVCSVLAFLSAGA